MLNIIKRTIIILIIIFLILFVFYIYNSNRSNEDDFKNIKENSTVEQRKNSSSIEPNNLEKNNQSIGVTSGFVNDKINNKEDFILYFSLRNHENWQVINNIIIPFAEQYRNMPIVIYCFEKHNSDNIIPVNNFENNIISNYGEAVTILYYKNGEVVSQIDRLSNYEGLNYDKVIKSLIDNSNKIYR